MAESSKTSAGNSKSSSGPTVTQEQIQAIIRAASNNPGEPNPAWPPPASVSPAEAMTSLLDMEEEALQEELRDPETTEEQRAAIRERLNGMQTQRRWFNFTRTLGSSSTNIQDAPPSADNKPSRTGKDPSR